MQTNPQLFIFTALACEAKPMINFFGLKKQGQHQAFALYSNAEMVLTVAGIGKIAMAGAVAYTMASYDVKMPVLVNIGVAGHKTKAAGDSCLALKISDTETGRRFYPQFNLKHSFRVCDLKTLSRPSTQYSADFLYDMEASAFYEMAVRFSSAELIQCYKIISDNEHASVEQITSVIVSEWIENKMDEIERLLIMLQTLKQSIPVIGLDEYAEIFDYWRFTVSGEIKLRALLKRWKVLTGGGRFSVNKDQAKTAKELIRLLEFRLKELEMN